MRLRVDHELTSQQTSRLCSQRMSKLLVVLRGFATTVLTSCSGRSPSLQQRHGRADMSRRHSITVENLLPGASGTPAASKLRSACVQWGTRGMSKAQVGPAQQAGSGRDGSSGAGAAATDCAAAAAERGSHRRPTGGQLCFCAPHDPAARRRDRAVRRDIGGLRGFGQPAERSAGRYPPPAPPSRDGVRRREGTAHERPAVGWGFCGVAPGELRGSCWRPGGGHRAPAVTAGAVSPGLKPRGTTDR